MTIVVVKKGLLSTVQDLGRYGMGRYGINPNGAMDCRMVRLLNILLGNPENEPVLEIHFPAPILEFRGNSLIALGGADFESTIDEDPIETGRAVSVKKGQRLKFRQNKSGRLCYLAIKGGIEADNWLDSASTNLTAGIGGFGGRGLQTGDEIRLRSEYVENCESTKHLISRSFFPCHARTVTKIRVLAGAEYDFLTGLGEEIFFDSSFEIAPDSNRMGFRLAGKPLHLLETMDMVSSAVSFGTVQLLPDGQLIVLMADHQTTGGYPRIANVVSADLPVLAQLRAHDKISFVPVSNEEAEEILESFEREVNLFRMGCRFAGSDI